MRRFLDVNQGQGEIKFNFCKCKKKGGGGVSWHSTRAHSEAEWLILAIKFGIDDILQVSCTFQDILESEIKSKHNFFQNKNRFSVKVAHL